MTRKPRVLVVDDEELIRWSLTQELGDRGFDVVEAESAAAALRRFDSEELEVVILDIRLPDRSGLDVLEDLRSRDPAVPIVMITGHGTAATAAEALRRGATEYIAKPFEMAEMALVVEKACARARLEDEVRTLRDRSARSASYGDLVGDSVAMQRLFGMLERLEQVDATTVLLTGESGTGKDLVARALHQRSRRASLPFLEVDCASLSETLIQSGPFGHERGAFTDARSRKAGLFEVAGSGTIFLDEIGEMALGTQAKLLRALENRRFKRVGGTHDIELEARVVAATNRDLGAAVAAGRFRQDLYYRLAVVPIEVPPLRDRAGDVRRLLQHFLHHLTPRLGGRVQAIDPAAAEALDAYEWPGNVRELRNVVERLMILAPGPTVRLSDLPPEFHQGQVAASAAADPFVLPEEGIDLAALEQQLVCQALERTGGNQSRAARLLGIGRYALRYRMKKLGMLDS